MRGRGGGKIPSYSGYPVRTLIIPEAGGDAGIGALRMLQALSGEYKVVLLDANEKSPARDMCPNFFHKVPRVEESLERAEEGFIRALGSLSLRDAIILPTAEFLPEILFRVLPVLKERGITTLLPSKAGWEISRDKLRLSKLPWTIPTSLKWSPEFNFAKPKKGVGSRDCQLVRTSEEADCLGEEFVFTPYLPGNDWVVDALYSKGKWHCLTREVFRQRGGADTDFTYREQPRIESLAVSVAESLGSPIANVQFRLSEEGSPLVIDVGTRLSGASCAARLAGVNWIGGILDLPGWWAPEYGKRITRVWEEVLL